MSLAMTAAFTALVIDKVPKMLGLSSITNGSREHAVRLEQFGNEESSVSM
jgi:hypothetical protein